MCYVLCDVTWDMIFFFCLFTTDHNRLFFLILLID